MYTFANLIMSFNLFFEREKDKTEKKKFSCNEMMAESSAENEEKFFTLGNFLPVV